MDTLYHGEIVISKDRKVDQTKKILEEYQGIFHYQIEVDHSTPYADSIIYRCAGPYPLDVSNILKELIQRFKKNNIYLEVCFSYTGFGNSSERFFYHYGTHGVVKANTTKLLGELD